MTAVCCSSFFRERVRSLSYVVSGRFKDPWRSTDPDWVAWYREVDMHIEYMMSVAETPKGFHFEDDTDEVFNWSEAQPSSIDVGTHGAIHALYIGPLSKLQADFEGAIYALTAIRPATEA